MLKSSSFINRSCRFERSRRIGNRIIKKTSATWGKAILSHGILNLCKHLDNNYTRAESTWTTNTWTPPAQKHTRSDPQCHATLWINGAWTIPHIAVSYVPRMFIYWPARNVCCTHYISIYLYMVYVHAHALDYLILQLGPWNCSHAHKLMLALLWLLLLSKRFFVDVVVVVCAAMNIVIDRPHAWRDLMNRTNWFHMHNAINSNRVVHPPVAQVRGQEACHFICVLFICVFFFFAVVFLCTQARTSNRR